MRVNERPRNLPRRLLAALLIALASHAALATDDGLAASTRLSSSKSAASLPPLSVASDDALPRTAWWPFSKPPRPPLYESDPHTVTRHPAVARIIVAEKNCTAFGSGTLVDVRDQYGLVVTNWHVVRDARGPVEVSFPNGFRSHARSLKVDSNWDLAALVIWRPPIEPVKLAKQPPRPGDPLTIHGYGRGQYRIATGRCTTYYAPRLNYPLEMVELDVEARQGDSGGPIFNHRGELAGVLFGAGQGTTLGSYAPRVSNFLATLAPDIGQANDQALVAIHDRPAPNVKQPSNEHRSDIASIYPSSPWSPPGTLARPVTNDAAIQSQPAGAQLAGASGGSANTTVPDDVIDESWYESLKSALAVVGLVAIALQLVKAVR
ncbi:MAG: serine protease [Pirellulales bacterium]